MLLSSLSICLSVCLTNIISIFFYFVSVLLLCLPGKYSVWELLLNQLSASIWSAASSYWSHEVKTWRRMEAWMKRREHNSAPTRPDQASTGVMTLQGSYGTEEVMEEERTRKTQVTGHRRWADIRFIQVYSTSETASTGVRMLTVGILR